MRIIKRSEISNFHDCGKYTSQSFPGIAVTPSGRIIASWRSAIRKEEVVDQRILCSFSDDGGSSWSSPKAFFTPPVLNGKNGVFRMGAPTAFNGRIYMHLTWVDASKPERPFFNEENSGLLDCKNFLSVSEDDGATWSEVQQLETEPFEELSTPITGPVQFFSDGEMFSQFELNKPFDSDDVWRHLPVLNFSLDQGKTFYCHSIPAQDPENDIFYWDQRPLILKNDSIVAFFWTWDNRLNNYHNISMTYSDDRGENWTLPHDTGIPGQAGQPVEFDDGSLLLPVVDRTGKPKITARLSRDFGKTFTDEVLEVSEPLNHKQVSEQNTLSGAWSEMTNFSLGLPFGTKSDHNTAYIVWYHGAETDFTNIEFAEIALT